MPLKTKIIFFLLLIAVLVGLGFFLRGGGNKAETDTGNNASSTTAITFSKTGVFVMNNPGMEKDIPYLIYEEPGKPAVQAKLKFDGSSVCVSSSGTLPCLASNISFDIIFSGKRVLVEGVSGSDGSVLVSKIRIQNENTGGTGILPYDSGVEGSVTLGPVCPVQRIPPDPNCADRPYVTTIQVIRVGSPKSSPFATAESGKDGRYKIMLPPGEYALQPVGGSVLPRCGTKEVTIEPSKIIEVNISCDTGIR